MISAGTIMMDFAVNIMSISRLAGQGLGLGLTLAINVKNSKYEHNNKERQYGI